MKSIDEIDAIADTLSGPMCHVLLRCDGDAGFWGCEETGCFREWRDVVYGRAHATFNGTVRALERRGLVVIKDIPGTCSLVGLNRDGRRVQATLRLRRMR